MDMTALFKLSYGLYALTTKDGDKENGCIVNTVMQITGDPVKLVVGVNKLNYSHDLIQRTGRFNLSTLTTDTPFSVFQGLGLISGRDVVNKLEGYAESFSANGIRYLADYANSYLSCEVLSGEDFGSHTLFTVSVAEAENLNKKDSVTYDYYHKHIKPDRAASIPKGKTIWVCRICGYVYEGEQIPPDFICPWCKHPASDFEKRVG